MKILTAIPKPLRAWVLPVLLLITWSVYGHVADNLSPAYVSILSVFERAYLLLASNELQLALEGSLTRLIKGLAIGAFIGFVVGGLLGASRLLDKLFGPSFNTLKQISLFAWIPLMSIWFGMGDTGKVVFLAMAAFFPMVVNTYEGVRSVPRELLEVARVTRLSRWQVIRLIVLPSAVPSIFTGFYLSIIYAWLAGIGAEYFLSSSPGVGTLLIDAQEHFLMDQIIVGVTVIGLVGLALNASAGRLEKSLLNWRGKSTATY